MNYWKGLAIAAVIDAAWLMGCPATSTEPSPLPPVETFVELAVEPEVEPEMGSIGTVEDSLMIYLQEHPEDVDAMERLAGIYADSGWYDSAISPLARALQLDPERRSLWVALDRAVERSGMIKITDAELVRRATQFVETFEAWGHGC
jgi:predicted Zn-dependent protease